MSGTMSGGMYHGPGFTARGDHDHCKSKNMAFIANRIRLSFRASNRCLLAKTLLLSSQEGASRGQTLELAVLGGGPRLWESWGNRAPQGDGNDAVCYHGSGGTGGKSGWRHVATCLRWLGSQISFCCSLGGERVSPAGPLQEVPRA